MPDNTTTAAPIGKLKRSHLLHYIDASFGGSIATQIINQTNKKQTILHNQKQKSV